MLRRELSALEDLGYRGGVVSVRHLDELHTEIEAPRRSGLVKEGVYDRYLSSFEWEPPSSLPDAASIFVVAVPDPAVRITFTWREMPVPVIVPPTYLHWRDVDQRTARAMEKILEPSGHHVVPANLPKKLTAVRTGLAAYGENDITYVPGMGSFHRPVLLWSDLPCEEDGWQELHMTATCDQCQACLRACPTGAIDQGRFLLHAERCLTLYNEEPHDVPFPEWVDTSWHNCLVGCLRCQNVCPENRQVRDWIVGDEVFSEEETALLLDGLPLDELPSATVAKVERLDLTELLDALPRNLEALLSKHEER
jgi:epoxyqueuosine reductase